MPTTTITGPKWTANYITCTGVATKWTSTNPSFSAYRQTPEPVKRTKPADVRFAMTNRYQTMWRKVDGFFWKPTLCTSGLFKGQTRLLPESVNDFNGLSAPAHALSIDDAEIINRLLDKIKNTKVNYGAMIAEAGEAANLLGDAAKMMGDALRCARRPAQCAMQLKNRLKPPPPKKRSWMARKKRPKKKRPDSGLGPTNNWLKKSSSGYLAASYGVMPVVDDILKTVQALENGLKDRSLVWKVTTTVGTASAVTPTYGTNTTTLINPKVTHRVKSTGIAYVEFDKPMVATLSELGISNPVWALWEVIPFSHVLDWMIDVGGYLQHLDTMIGVKRYSACVIHRKLSREIRVNKYGGTARAYRMTYDRHLLDLTAIPMPRWSPRTKLTNVLETLAMMRQML